MRNVGADIPPFIKDVIKERLCNFLRQERGPATTLSLPFYVRHFAFSLVYVYIHIL